MSARHQTKVTLRFYSDLPEHQEILEFLNHLPKDRRGIRNLQNVLETPILELARDSNKARKAQNPKPQVAPVVSAPEESSQELEDISQSDHSQSQPGSLLAQTLSNCNFR